MTVATKAPLHTGKGSVTRKNTIKQIDSRNDGKPEGIFKSQPLSALNSDINEVGMLPSSDQVKSGLGSNINPENTTTLGVLSLLNAG